MDRERCELSSDSGYVEDIDLETLEKSDQCSKIEEANNYHSPGKKLNFSPIVWDRDDKEISNICKIVAPFLQLLCNTSFQVNSISTFKYQVLHYKPLCWRTHEYVGRKEVSGSQR